MSTYRILPCMLAHLRELATTMRAEDRAEIEGCGLVVRHTLAALWRRSTLPRVAIVDGLVAAAWGDEAGVLEGTGRMWLFTAPPVERLPVAFFRETRREVAERLRVRRALIADVAESYTKAARFFTLLGFSFGAPVAAPSGKLYRRMTIERE